MSDVEIELLLKQRREAKAKLAINSRAEILKDIETLLQKKWSGIALSDLG
jgi:hypothetical protein